MRLKLYLDTSVLGALTDPGPEDRLVATRRVLHGLATGLWDGHISTLDLEEIGRAPNPIREAIGRELRRGFRTVLDETAESLRLSGMYVSAGAVPTDYENDARHIAIATMYDIRVYRVLEFPAYGEHRVEAESQQREPSRRIAACRSGLAMGGCP